MHLPRGDACSPWDHPRSSQVTHGICRVANELGAGSKLPARLAARMSILLGLGVMSLAGLLLFACR